ncbi:MAG: SNF2-related protein [Balneolaceae bacterium]
MKKKNIIINKFLMYKRLVNFNIAKKMDLFDHNYSMFWPSNEEYPLNLRNGLEKRTVEQEIIKDISSSMDYLVVTGFTSLSYLVDLFYKIDPCQEKKFRIVLGFDPIIRQRKKWPRVSFSSAVKDFWINQGVSPLQSGGLIKLIDHIEKGDIDFRISEKIHAKIYVGSKSVILGSSNFSKNGLTKQTEANVRFDSESRSKSERIRYKEIKNIANNFYSESEDYKVVILSLLKELLKLSSWQEVLARATSELLEGIWIRKYSDTFKNLKDEDLWPVQKEAIGQAIHIIDNQGSVLIADATGSGKTRLACNIQLCLINRRWMKGKGDRANSLVICPPIVIDNWNREYEKLHFFQQAPLSNGILSFEGSRKHKLALNKIKDCNIIIIDEAHNYLNPKSFRSLTLKNSSADSVMLITATPINRKVDDLLRLIELLDIDNLNDEELKQYKTLCKNKDRHSLSQLDSLNSYIRKFTVRRTKKQMNDSVSKEKEKYRNSLGNLCRYPNHVSNIYKTGETNKDKSIAKEIDRLTQNLYGIVYLRTIKCPLELKNKEEVHDKYITRRLTAAKALARYQIKSKLRSSKAALIEHILGTDAATRKLSFISNKSRTGNIVQTLEKIINSDQLPSIEFEEKVLPDFLKNKALFFNACEKEIQTYLKISDLANKLSIERELSKLKKIKSLFKDHNLILAFDSTIITLDYLEYLSKNIDLGGVSLVISGENKSNKERAKKIFGLGSKEEKCIGFCSDSMSEGVNLQQASAVLFLDMPSVLRIAEQRIGRLDRMDSPHDKIFAYWPDDTNEFALKTDKKLIRISFLADYLIGSNLDLPEDLLDKHFDEKITAQEMIREFENIQSTEDWEGFHDAFQPVRSLTHGERALISEEEYEYFMDVSANVRCKVSIVESSSEFAFFALKGSEISAPKWLFIKNNGEITSDLNMICAELSSVLINVKNSNWDEKSEKKLSKYLGILEKNEIKLLSHKKRRSLMLLKDLLNFYKKEKGITKERKEVLEGLLRIIKPSISSEDSIDYQEFADNWLQIILPRLIEIRKKARRNYPKSISNLLAIYKKEPIQTDILKNLLLSVPFLEKIDKRIAACIIGVSNEV